MNIQVQCCGLGILVVLLYFYFQHKEVGLYTERFFKIMLVMTFVSVSLDILSIVGIVYREGLPAFVTASICKLYMSTLVWGTCMGFIYICMDVFSGKKLRNIIIVYTAILVLATILIFILKIEYFLDGKVVYSYGPSNLVTYIFAFFYVINMIYVLIQHGTEINPRRCRAVSVWAGIWIVAGIVQFFNNELLLVGYASSVGMMILFFELENPKANVDRETGAFNLHALLEYMRQLYLEGKQFGVIAIYLEPEQDSNIDISQLDGAMISIVKFLETTGNAKVFKNVERELLVIYEEQEQLEDAFLNIKKRFRYVWNEYHQIYKPVKMKPHYILMPDSSVAESAEEVYDLMRFYRLKDNELEGRKEIRINQKLADERRDRKRMERTIVHALEDDRIEVFLQPIYSTEKQSFVSAEALVRLRKKDGEYLSPAKFIPVAEESELIERIGERVFDKTCQFIKGNNISKYGLEYIEINLSAKQCENPELPQTYINIMKKYDLKPSYINLEVTESAAIQMKQQVIENMQSLIEYGVTFSLDDFGNGQSNLNYIVDMPVHIVKFDKDMTQAYFANDKAKFVLEAAIHMIHGMQLKMVSEGVETKEQLMVMTELGIQYIQGYYFSKPLPMSDFMVFIKKQK